MSNPSNFPSNDIVFLSPQTKLEPLVCRWYAWPHLISPAQLALHIEYRLLPLLHSFVSNPSVHVSANRDPSMYGGPFMSLTEQDVTGVQQLIEHTTASCADLITLAKDLRAVAGKLEEQAGGFSLNDFYATLPTSLQGLVEYLYDANSHASIRLFEDLVYDEYPTSHAQEIMLQVTGERDRHFFMSTPACLAMTACRSGCVFPSSRLPLRSRSRTGMSRTTVCACASSDTPACCSRLPTRPSCSIRLSGSNQARTSA